MYRVIALDGMWRVSWSEDGPEDLIGGTGDGRMWLDANVPCPIHQVLMQAGLLEDPNYGLNSLKARWVEEQVWVYRTQVNVPADALRGSQWLIFDWLEHRAAVHLNGALIGRHANSHRRAVFDVTGKLREGVSTLVVAVESGLHEANDLPASPYGFDRYAMLTRRPWMRKAQYQSGWDWNPRMMNVGILGSVRLECSDVPVMDSVSVVSSVDQGFERGVVRVRAYVRWPEACRQGSVRIRAGIAGRDTSAAVEADDPSRPARCELMLDVAHPDLWWPVGHGEQSLYDVDLRLEADDANQQAVRRTGFRHVEIDQSPHPDGGKHFIVCVNGRRVFCKGGNWAPPDLMPSRVAAERYEDLVKLALEANFNTLRVWGGGVFAPEALLDACDRSGILVWHDFLFACAKYPADDPDFVTEVEAEVTEAVRRMAHHPSLAVWCGNNEVEWGDREWGYRQRKPVAPHHALFHYHIPAILAEEDTSKVYWPSSPWSPDYAPPNDPTVGDQHPWGVSILDPGPADFHKYRGYVDRFPNEGGVLGASPVRTLKEFLPEDHRRMLSPVWVHHDNPIGYRSTRPGEPGRSYHTFQYWLGLDPFTLDWETYAKLSGVLQAEGLCEYIANYRRRMFGSAAAIFWSYNDSWPVTHGWTIVDYHLRQKLAYHPVRRAFQPVAVFVVEEGDEIGVFGVNDTAQTWEGSLRYGLFRLDGVYPLDEATEVRLPASASTRLAHFARRQWEAVGYTAAGAFGLLTQGAHMVAQHRLFKVRFAELEWCDRPIQLSREGPYLVIQSAAFAWGVCLDAESGAHLADNCFDLLPGVRYTVPWPVDADLPAVEAVASAELVRLLRRR